MLPNRTVASTTSRLEPSRPTKAAVLRSQAVPAASASSGGCARRSNFISAIAGFAVPNSKTRFLIIRPSRSIATAASATATSYAMCLRLWCGPGLVKGEGLAVDASVMEADASRYHGKAPDEIDWSGVAEHHAALARTTRSGQPGRYSLRAY